MEVRLAISGDAPALSAATYRLFTVARRLTVPSELRISWNVSHAPAVARLAISAEAPAFSAATNCPLLLARSATLPLARLTTSNRSLVPAEVLLAISAVVALGALTY